MKLESGKESRISTTPARLRVAGVERSPLRRDRPAYDLSLIDPGHAISTIEGKRGIQRAWNGPGGSFDISKNSRKSETYSYGPLD